MDAMMKIGNEISMKEAAAPVAQAVVDVLKAIGDNHIDREVAIEALKVVGMTAGVNGVSISNCNLTSEAMKSPPAATFDSCYYKTRRPFGGFYTQGGDAPAAPSGDEEEQDD